MTPKKNFENSGKIDKIGLFEIPEEFQGIKFFEVGIQGKLIAYNNFQDIFTYVKVIEVLIFLFPL